MSEPTANVVRMIQQDREAELPSFEGFFEAENQRLYRALCLITRNRFEAEEITQDAFVRVLERWDRVSTMEDPTGYLYATAMNTFRKLYRRSALAAKRSIGATPADDDLERIESTDAAIRAMAPLSPRQRAAVVLVDLLGYRSEEAGKMLGLRAGTVRTHLSRGHGVLKETLER